VDSIDLVTKLVMDTKEYADSQAGAVANTKAWSSALSGAVSAGVAAAVAAIALLVAAIVGVGITSFNVANETQEAWNRFSAQTGAADDEMESFKQTALDIYSSNWGDSIVDVGQAMTTVKQITGETGDELESLTAKALIMRDVFDKDIQESIRAVDTAVVNFGVDGGHVFDLITATIQKVGDPANDLLDTVNEYSPIFAEAGYSADEMFGILQAGLAAGARNFDVVADAIKEFQIRIIDGSDSTESALNQLLATTGMVSDEYVTLEAELAETGAALEANTAALDEAEGAYAASKAIVDDLSRALGEARRELNELARPNLAGMEAFDDQLFELEQQSKQAKLALLGMVEDSPEYEAAKQRLDDINKEMDRISLERDITFDRQLRNIEKAATAGLDPVMTYDEVIGQIGAKKGEIAELESAFTGATAEMARNAGIVKNLKDENTLLTKDIDKLKAGLEAIGSPAEEWLQGLYDGSMSGKEAMDQVNNMLSRVDQETRDAVGPLLYGTKWEDLKDTIILSMGKGIHYAQQVEGALDAAGEAATRGLGASLEKLKRRALVALQPIGQILLDLAERGMPYVEKAFSWFEEKLPPIIDTASDVLVWFGDVIKSDVLPFVQESLLPAFKEFGDWLLGEGVPAFIEFITPIIQQVIPGLQLLGQIAFNIATTVWPILTAAIQFVMDHMNIFMPILAAVGVLILALTSPVSLVIGAIVLLATAWANNWGGIQEKTQAVLDFIMPFIQAAMQFIGNTVSSVLKGIQSWWKQHGDSVMTIVKAAWNFVLNIINTNLQAAWAVIQIVINLIKAFWEEWGDTIITLTKLVWDTISIIISTTMDLIGYIIDAAAALIRGDWSAFGDALQNIWQTVWDAIKMILNNAKAALISIMSNLISIIVDEHWTPFVDRLKAAWDNMWLTLSDTVNSIITPIKNALQPLFDMIEGMVSGIRTILDNIPFFGGSGGGIGSTDWRPPDFGPGSAGAGNTVQNFTQNNYFGSSGNDTSGEFQQMAALLGT
jgi:hypothetical protein